MTSPEPKETNRRAEGIAVDRKRILTGVGVAAAFVLSIAVPITISRLPNAIDEAQGATGGMTDQENADKELPQGMGSVSEGLPESAAFLAPQPLFYASYQIEKGDTIGELAERFGLTQDTILTFNGIKNSRLLQIGKYLKIPNQDGILYTTKADDTLESIAEQYEIEASSILAVNRSISEGLDPGSTIFLPEARLSRVALQEINGDLFIWPVRGYISSGYGYRISPFTGVRQFHTGLDIAAPLGTPIKAAMAGRVTATGYDVNTGNYVVIAHHSGYRTMYGHMSVIRVAPGDYVKTGQRIGDVGSTGLSTGSHCHFGVFKYGATVNPRAVIN